jgi:hypothetical protein
VRPLGDCVCEGCGKEYWRNQAWQHDKCTVANKPVLVANSVANRKKDRHKNKEHRKAYMRELMRKKRGLRDSV